MAAMTRGKDVLSLYVDGLDIKLAHLSLKGKQITVHELKSATLAAKIEERKAIEASASGLNDGIDAFNIAVETPMPTMAMGERDSEDNNSVLLGLLSPYPVRKYLLTYSIAEPALYYHQLESDFGLKRKKLKERVIEELRKIRSFQPAPDAVGIVNTDEGGVLCVVREEGLSLINLMENIKGFLGKRMPMIAGIDSSDVALMNMVRLNYPLEQQEVTVIINVGVEFTRLIFMRGSQFYQFAPILSEGYDSPNLQNTVYSRLLLEQDNLAIQRISKIILTGESKRIGFKDFLEQQLPDQHVEYLMAPELDTSALPPEEQDLLSAFAVPIGAAWKVLAGGGERFYDINLLPDSVREAQRQFKLSWHGYVLLAAIFLSTLFFTTQIRNISRELQERKSTLAMKNSQVAENTTLTASIRSLTEEIGKYKNSLALYDTLVPGADRWSRALTRLSHGVEDLNSIWLTDLSATEAGAVVMNGFAVHRERIPRIATLFENSLLKEVNTQEIRKQVVYKYRIDVPNISPTKSATGERR